MRILLLVSLLLLGCSSSKPSLTIQKNHVIPHFAVFWAPTCEFPESFLPVIEDGFRFWNNQLGKEFFLRVPGCGVQTLQKAWEMKEYVLIIRHSEQPSTLPVEHEDSKVLAVTVIHPGDGRPKGGKIFFYPSFFGAVNSFQVLSTVRHELGHILGLGHIEKPDCLMYPFIQADLVSEKGLCEEEVAAIRSLYERKDQHGKSR